MKNKLFILLILIFLVNLSFRIYSYSGEYLSKYDSKYWQDRYLRSQWVDPLSKESIGDDGLYAYAGWEYVHGRDPSTLNAEIPPLGKYILGFTTVIFGNQNIFALLNGIFVLVSFFVLNKIIFKNNLLAFLPVFILSFDSLFYTQLRAPYLDLLYLGFLIMTFIFFLKEKFFISFIFLGFMMATKASSATFVLVFSSMIIYWFYKNKNLNKIKKIIIYSPVSLGIFLLTYSIYFFHGHNIIDFLKVQKWILNFYAIGAKGNPISALQILFTGNWPTWWGQTLRVNEWTILWALSLFATAFCLAILIFKYFSSKGKNSITNGMVLLTIWVSIYLIFLTFVPTFPRYLLLILPFMYTLSIWIFSKKIPWFSSDQA